MGAESFVVRVYLLTASQRLVGLRFWNAAETKSVWLFDAPKQKLPCPPIPI